MTDRNQALQRIVKQACQGELVFPTNMAASLRLQRALDDPECHLEAIADMVLAEPLIAARLVAIANSVAYTRCGAHVSNVRRAITLMGMKPLRALVAVIVVRQLAEQITDSALKRQAEQLWQHCAHVAALAKVLAREFATGDPDSAMFAGAVHEIDAFYLLARAGEMPELLSVEPDAAGHDARAELSACMLRVLKIPRQVADAVDALYSDDIRIPPQSLGDLLCLSNGLAPVASPLTAWAGGCQSKLSADVDCAVGDHTLRQVLTDHEQEIRSIADGLLI